MRGVVEPEELPFNCAFRLSQAGFSEVKPEMEFGEKIVYEGSTAWKAGG